MSIRRNYHWTDLEVGVNPDRTRNYQRAIKNWINFRRPDSNNINKLLAFESADNNAQPTQVSAPDHWTGNYDFQYQLLNQPLQIFLGDSTTPQNTALWGMRRADNPRAWVNFKAIGGINSGVPMEVFGPQRAVRWQNLWNNSTLWLRASRQKVAKQIRLSSPGHPASFKFAMRIPVGYSYEVIDNQILIKDENGEIQLRTSPPHGWDSATVGFNPDGSQHIRATLIETNSVTIGNKTFPAFLIIPNADDLTSAVYPVFIDPDITIVGQQGYGHDAIDDTFISSAWQNYNYGKRGYLSNTWKPGTSQRVSSVIRVWTSELPEALVITTFQLDAGYYQDRSSAVATMRARRILDKAWEPGLYSHLVRAGVACWTAAKLYSVNWTTPGCEGNGTDYATPIVEDTFETKATVTNYELWSLSFTGDGLDWPRGWKDGDYDNNGIVITTDTDGASDALWYVGSTQDSFGRDPRFYIEYSNTATSPSAAIFFGSNF